MLKDTMILTVASISMANFRVIMMMESYSIAIFEAAWMIERKVAKDRLSIFEAMTSFGKPLPVIYHITVNGSDDAEDFVVDKLLLSHLPAVAIFSHGGKVEHTARFGTGGNLNYDLFVAEFDRIRNISLLQSKVAKAPLGESNISIPGTQLARPLPLEAIVSLIFGDVRNRENTLYNCVHMTDICYVESDIDKDASEVLTLFLSGDKSSVGKSSICLAILASLIRLGVDPSAIAYIKPVTQCEAEQPVTDYCSRVGIEHCGVGPVVFYKGFTRAYLRKETLSADVLKQLAVDAVKLISASKRVVIIDGVGYPSVGSICNLSNADIAHALRTPVLLVGKSGVGDAVDSFNMNARFFESYGVTVLGGVFNKLPQDGFYNLESCREAVTSYFKQYCPGYIPYGFIPLLRLDCLKSEKVEPTETVNIIGGLQSTSNNSSTIPISVENTIKLSEEDLVDAFLKHVNFGQLLFDMFKYSVVSKGVKINVASGSGLIPLLKLHSTDQQALINYGHGEEQEQEQGPQHLLHGYETVSKTRSYSFGDFNVSMEDTISKVKRQKLDGVEHLGPRNKSSLLELPLEEWQTHSKHQTPLQHLSREEIEALAMSQGAKVGG